VEVVEAHLLVEEEVHMLLEEEVHLLVEEVVHLVEVVDPLQVGELLFLMIPFNTHLN
jgi:hypothetical protein